MFKYNNTVSSTKMPDTESDKDSDKNAVSIRDARRTVIITTFLLFMLVTLVLLTGGIYFSEAWNYSTDDSMCLPCKHLGVPSNREVVGIPDEWKQEYGSCCATGQTLKKLVQLYVNYWYKIKLDKDNPTFNYCERKGKSQVATIKLVGATGSSHGNDRHVIHWMNPPEVMIGNSLSYSHGHVHILETGLFWVYSQVVFSDDGRTDNLTTSTPVMFNHTVVKRYRDEETILMTAVKTPDECGGTSTGSKTSYLGSYLLLYEGDNVAVKVYSPSEFKFHSQMNFLGIHKTSPESEPVQEEPDHPQYWRK